MQIQCTVGSQSGASSVVLQSCASSVGSQSGASVDSQISRSRIRSTLSSTGFKITSIAESNEIKQCSKKEPIRGQVGTVQRALGRESTYHKSEISMASTWSARRLFIDEKICACHIEIGRFCRLSNI